MFYAFVGVVVDVREPRFPSLGQGVCFHGKTVVLGCDETPLGSHLEAGLVLASVPGAAQVKEKPNREERAPEVAPEVVPGSNLSPSSLSTNPG